MAGEKKRSGGGAGTKRWPTGARAAGGRPLLVIKDLSEHEKTVLDSAVAVVLLISAVGSVLSVLSLRRAAREDGELAALGAAAGATRITSAAAKSRRNWNIFGWFLIRFVVFIQAVNFAAMDPNTPNLSTNPTTLNFWGVAAYNLAWAPAANAWMVSLKFAATLASERVDDARQKIAATDADAPQWDFDVVPANLRLLQTTLPTLSRGWGSGLVGLFLAKWSSALPFYIGIMAYPHWYYIVSLLSFLGVPFVLALPAASASSACDGLHTALNE